MNTALPQVVSINAHPNFHYAYAMQALDAGCHSVHEKPLAKTVAEAEETVAVAQDNGLKIVGDRSSSTIARGISLLSITSDLVSRW